MTGPSKSPFLGRAPLLVALGAVCLLGLPAQAKDGQFHSVSAQRLPASHTWPGFQFLQADKRGHVFDLNGSTLEIFELDADGDLRKRGALERKSGSEPVSAWNAAMGASGDWMLWQPPNALRYFRSGEEASVPSTSWAVSAVGLLQSGPILAVLPASIGAPEATADPRDELTPVVLTADESSWKALVLRKPFERGNHNASVMQEVKATSDVLIVPGPNDSFWLSYQNAYLLRQFSAQGKALDEVRVGDGVVRWVDRSDADWREIEDAAKAQGRTFIRSNFPPVRSVRVSRAAAAASDGRLYLLVEAEDGFALDRYDPSSLTLERVLLPSVDLGPGRLNLAAGQDGLYLGGRTGESGRWRVSWEALDQAAWRPVPGASRNGMPLNLDQREPAKAVPAKANGRR